MTKKITHVFVFSAKWLIIRLGSDRAGAQVSDSKHFQTPQNKYLDRINVKKNRKVGTGGGSVNKYRFSDKKYR